MEILNQEIITKIAIGEVISGYLHRGGELFDVPTMLRDMAEDYEREIQKEADA